MRLFIICLSFLFFSFQVAATCSYNGATQRVNMPLPAKILADDSLPTGTILAVKTVGGNVSGMKAAYNCAASDVFKIQATPNVTLAPGVTGIQGKPVYETGIKGIGFQISDATKGTNYRPVPAEFTTVPLSGGGTSKSEQVTVWLIKTKDTIDTNTPGPQNITISYQAGAPNQVDNNSNDSLLLQINLKLGTFNYKETSCDITPGKSLINIPRIDIAELIKAGKSVTPKKKDIKLSIKCPSSSIGTKYIYWFNPITESSTTTNGVLLNSILPPLGAENVGFILRDQNDSSIKFYNYSSYSFLSVVAQQTITLSADYYMTNSQPKPGRVKAIFEVVIQEE